MHRILAPRYALSIVSRYASFSGTGDVIGRMKTVEEVRRQRLALLREEFGTLARLNELLGLDARDSTLSQLLNASPNSRTGKAKTMGSGVARRLEQACGKEHGWMDTDPDLTGEPGPGADERGESLEVRRGIALRLVALRTAQGLTLQQAADTLALPEAVLSNWESGLGVPDGLRLRAMAKLYGVSVDAILWEDSLSPAAMEFAAEFDALSEEQQRTLRAVWLAFVQQGSPAGEQLPAAPSGAETAAQTYARLKTQPAAAPPLRKRSI